MTSTHGCCTTLPSAVRLWIVLHVIPVSSVRCLSRYKRASSRPFPWFDVMRDGPAILRNSRYRCQISPPRTMRMRAIPSSANFTVKICLLIAFRRCGGRDPIDVPLHESSFCIRCHNLSGCSTSAGSAHRSWGNWAYADSAIFFAQSSSRVPMFLGQSRRCTLGQTASRFRGALHTWIDPTSLCVSMKNVRSVWISNVLFSLSEGCFYDVLCVFLCEVEEEGNIQVIRVPPRCPAAQPSPRACCLRRKQLSVDRPLDLD